VSLAFGPEGKDIIYGSVASDGTVTIHDAKSSSTNPLDDSVENFSGTATGSRTANSITITFTRKVDTGDSTEDFVLTPDEAFRLTYRYSNSNSETVDYTNAVSGTVNFTVAARHAIQLIHTDNYFLWYELNSAETGATWTVKAAASSTGWVGIGFGGTVITDTDIVYGYFDNGSLVVVDAKAQGDSQPTTDTTTNISNIWGVITNGFVTITFERLFSTGDTVDDFVIPLGSGMNVVWAYGDTPTAVHTTSNKGSVSVTVSSPDAVSGVDKDGFTLSYTINADNTEISWSVTAPTTGWIALAFGPGGSDVVYGSVDGSGTLTLKDAKYSGGTLTDDTNQNFIGTPAGSESGGSTTITFVRAVNTGDSADDYIIPTGQDIQIVYRYSNTNSDTVDFTAGVTTTVHFHISE